MKRRVQSGRKMKWGPSSLTTRGGRGAIAAAAMKMHQARASAWGLSEYVGLKKVHFQSTKAQKMLT